MIKVMANAYVQHPLLSTTEAPEPRHDVLRRAFTGTSLHLWKDQYERCSTPLVLTTQAYA